MKQNISLWQFAGFSLTSLLGTLLHFLYDWTNGNVLAAFVSGVNESTWEHMKLMYFPLLIFALVQSRFFEDVPAFWCVKLVGIATALLLIPIFFYTYNGMFGESPDWINITIFFVSAAIAFYLETRILRNQRFSRKHPLLAFLMVCLIGVLFVTFTFVTPKLPLFQDPLTGAYGMAPA